VTRRRTRIGTIAKIGAGQGAPQDPSSFSGDGYPFIRAGSLEMLCAGGDTRSLERINLASAEKHRMKLYREGTVVFAKSGMSAMKNRVLVLSGPAYVVNHLATLEVTPQVDPVYLRYFWEAFDSSRLIHDPAYPSISLEAITEVEIELPPLPEQKRIAAVLAKADRLRRLRRYARELSDTYLQSVFLEMFGDGDGRKTTIQELLQARAILDMHDGNHGEAHPRRSDFVSQGIPFLTATNVIDDQVFLDSAPCISPERASELRIGWIKPGDVLLSHNATVGRVGVVPSFRGRVVIGTSLTYYRLNSEVFLPACFAQVLRSRSFQSQLESMMKQTTRNQVPITRQRELLVPAPPPLPLQQQFARIVHKFERLRAQQREAERQAEHVFQTLLHQAFRGEL